MKYKITNIVETMSKIELFGFHWKNENLDHRFININVLTNNQVGKVVMTLNCLQTITLNNEWNEKDNYKILSLMYEKNMMGKPYFLYVKEDKDTIEKSSIDFSKYTLIEFNRALNEFPKNIIELQQRSLMLLYRKSPKYGDDIGDIITYDFFAENQCDMVFVLEAMLNKNWIDVKIKKGADGFFIFSKPFMIAENGWIEIERCLEITYSKQVFVAMCFDKKMDKAAQKMEEAIRACGLESLRIDRKEHNNEISGEILQEIIKSKIVIADVTYQRNGVYFEAGFALGHKKSVIWSCQKEDLKNVHFDTRQYNHIVWEDEDDLYIKLKDRIMATLAIENS